MTTITETKHWVTREKPFRPRCGAEGTVVLCSNPGRATCRECLARRDDADEGTSVVFRSMFGGSDPFAGIPRRG